MANDNTIALDFKPWSPEEPTRILNSLTAGQHAQASSENLYAQTEKTRALLPGELAQQGATLKNTAATTAHTNALTQLTKVTTHDHQRTLDDTAAFSREDPNSPGFADKFSIFAARHPKEAGAYAESRTALDRFTATSNARKLMEGGADPTEIARWDADLGAKVQKLRTDQETARQTVKKHEAISDYAEAVTSKDPARIAAAKAKLDIYAPEVTAQNALAAQRNTMAGIGMPSLDPEDGTVPGLPIAPPIAPAAAPAAPAAPAVPGSAAPAVPPTETAPAAPGAPAGSAGVPAPAAPAPRVPFERMEGEDYMTELRKRNVPLHNKVRNIMDLNEAPPTGRAALQGYGMVVDRALHQAMPHYDATEWSNKVKTVLDFGAGVDGKKVRSFDVALAHLDTLERLIKEMHNTDSPAFNRIANVFKTQFGYPAPTSVDAAGRIVGDEVVNAVVAARGALGDREEVQKTLDKNLANGQLIGPGGTIPTYKELMAGQIAGMQRQFVANTKLGEDVFQKKLAPATVETLLKKVAPGGAVHVSSPEEARKLPSGTPIILPDGNTGKVP